MAAPDWVITRLTVDNTTTWQSHVFSADTRSVALQPIDQDMTMADANASASYWTLQSNRAESFDGRTLAGTTVFFNTVTNTVVEIRELKGVGN